MNSDTKNVLLGALIVIVVIGAYYYGAGSKDIVSVPTQVTSEQQSFGSKEVVENVQVGADSLQRDSTNGLNCKNVANQAARNSQRADNSVTMTQSNFSKVYNNCYYELQFTYASGGNVSTEIHVAPNDDWLVQCTSGIYPAPQKFCTAHNTYYPQLAGQITEGQYDQIRSQYLTN